MAIKFNSIASRYSATAMGITGKNVNIRTASAKASAAAKCVTAAKKNVNAKNMVTVKNSLIARSSATKTSKTKSNQSSLAYKAIINSGKAASSSKKYLKVL